MTLSAALPQPSKTEVQPRSVGAVRVTTKRRLDGKTALADLRQSGAMKALFPSPRSQGLHAIMVNTAGGITGGDRFGLSASAGEGTALSLTTQAAERVYKAQPDECARVTNHLSVEANARANWLPQETILFEGCALERQLDVTLAANASLLLVESLVLGRATMGETLRRAYFKDRICIRRQGKPLFLDAIALSGDVTAHMASPNVADGAGALALIVYVAADAEAQLASLRAQLSPTAGASLIGADLLVARVLATDSYKLRKAIIPILEHLSKEDLPRSWMT